jgi:hypothetical protein
MRTAISGMARNIDDRTRMALLLSGLRAEPQSHAVGLNFTKVSKRLSQLSHSQKFRISSPLRHSENSRDSGAIMSSPHFGQDGRPKQLSWK